MKDDGLKFAGTVLCFDADTNKELGSVSREIAREMLQSGGVAPLMNGRYVYGLRIKQDDVVAEVGKDRPPTGKALVFQERVADHKLWQFKRLRPSLEPLYKSVLVRGAKGSAVTSAPR